LGFIIYLSVDPVVTTNDLRMATRSVVSLAPGTSSTGVTAVAISATFTNFGTYYLGAIADYGNLIPEISESNNVIVAGTVEIGRAYDYVVTALSSSTNGYTGGILVISNTVRNTGLDNAPASILGFYLSSDPIITTNDVRIGTRNVAALSAGASSTTNSAILISATNIPGTYYLGAIADYGAVLPESTETNNSLLGNGLVLNIGPDIEAVRVTGPAGAAQSTTTPITTVVKNIGFGDPGPFTVGIYLSPDTNITTNDIWLGYAPRSGLAPGASSTNVTSVAIPAGVPSGAYYWGMVAILPQNVAEITKTNNAKAQEVSGGSCQLGPAINLIVSQVTGPADHCTGNPFILTNIVSNIGTANSPSFNVGLYLSFDDVITTNDILMWTRTVSSLAVGRSDTNFMTLVNLGGLDPGLYYFGAIVDPQDKIAETDENNARLGNLHEVNLGPDLVVDDIICQAFASQGTTIPVTSLIHNQGCGNAPQSFTVGVYLSPDPQITTADTRLGGRTINSLGVGMVSTGTVSIALSATLASATYYVGVIADDGNRIYESSETNNALLGTPVVIRPAADLVMEAISGPTNGCTGSSIVIRNTVVNNGTDNAGAFAIALYLSADTNITTSDFRLVTRNVTSLPPGQTNGAVTTAPLPLTLAPGTYFVGAIADYLNALPESDETNNATAGNLIEIAIGPELIMTTVTGPSVGAQGSTITITNAISNVGCGDAPSTTLGLYLSTDPIITTTDIRIGTRVTPVLTAGLTSTSATTLTLSATLPSGIYYLGGIADYGNGLLEGSEANNSIVGATIEIQPGIDLIVAAAEGLANAATGMQISITNLVRNIGTAGVGPFSVGIFISTNDTIGTNDIRIGTNTVPGLVAGQSTTNVTTFVIANTISPGLYYLGVIADDLGIAPEIDETNNILGLGVIDIVLGPDLVVTSMTGPASAPAGGSLSVTNTVVNTGSGQANISFRVGVYLSTDNIITLTDTLLNNRFINSMLGGQTNSGAVALQLPSTLAPGTYYMGSYVDYQFRVPESNETNNMLTGYSFEILPLRLTTVRVEGADVLISFETTTARSYRLQQCDTLGGTWTTVTGATSLAGTGAVVTFRHVGGASSGRRFYRVQLL
jgi:large repetitive protein